MLAHARSTPDSGPIRRYRALTHTPHGPRLIAGAAAFYPGQAAIGLVILLALHHATGSFAVAGAGGAASTLGFSLSALAQGRLVDRHGARILLAMAAACAVAIVALGAALAARANAAVLIVLAGAVGGSVPSAGTALRTIWASLLQDPDDRATAFAYQSLMQDAGYVVGPSALGALATAVSPELALGCCGALLIAGAAFVAGAPSLVAEHGPDAASPGPRGLVALIPLAVAMAAVGVALGAVDVSITAFATEHHGQRLAGVLLAAYSLGSIAGGVTYGARRWGSGLTARMRWCAFAMALLGLAPVFAPSLALAAPALMLAGAPLAAALTTAYLLAAELAPRQRQTEAYALLSLTINAGAALGGAVGGQLVTGGSARPGLLLAAACPLATVAVLGIGALIDRRARAPRCGDRARTSSAS